MQIEKLKRFESATCPGVAFTVRRLGKIQRSARDFPIMTARLRMSEIAREWQMIPKPDAGGNDPRLTALNYEASLLTDRDITPAVLRAGIASIEGIDGVSTVDALLADASPELDVLIAEMFDACEAASGLTGEQQKNSESPTTSTAPVVSENSNTSAGTAV